ncbi:hypothetical protein AJ80_06633 [Polytolypa hystricis UAMH7299]|uniref:PH-like domain-containing protein n=1 Tax=Polytolypa hystricis (strain UAMH7299) TaxID=1447883 RepID=A0A2B7XW05_POLH7|nr:hypothetical protein AJ80_06633 [Polytolypa hystricis UAMH7299]
MGSYVPLVSPSQKSPLLDLLAFIRNEVQTLAPSELIRIPSAIIDSVFQSFAPLDISCLADLIGFFDGNNKHNCSRLDAVSFRCILHGSLRQLTKFAQEGDKSPRAVASRQRKWLLLQKSFDHFFRVFISKDESSPRRWGGQFVLEFIRDTHDKACLLPLAPQDLWQALGKIVCTDQDYSLRCIAGAIVCEMHSARLGLRLFTPFDTQGILSILPTSTLADTAWLHKLQEFINYLDSKAHNMAHSMNSLVSLDAPGLKRPVGGCILALSGLDTLMFMVVHHHRLQFVDVPLRYVKQLHQHDQAQTVQVELDAGGHYILNGQLKQVTNFSMVFNTAAQLAEATNAIEEKLRFVRSGQTCHLRGNQFGPIDHSAGGTTKSARRYSSATLDISENEPESDVASKYSPVGKPTTLNVLTTGVQRRCSSALVELPTVDQLLSDSSAYSADLQDECGSNREAGDNFAQILTAVNQEQNINLVDAENIEPSAVKSVPRKGHGHPYSHDAGADETPGGCQTEAITTGHIVLETQASSIVDSGVNADSEDPKEKGGGRSVEPQPGVGVDFLIRLPSLAQQALQLQPHDITTPSLQVTNSLPESFPQSLIQTSIELVPLTLPTDTVEVPDSQGQQMEPGGALPVPVVDHVGTHTTPAGDNVSDNCSVQNGCSGPETKSKLKRPHHKIGGSLARKGTVDWDQDLRVDDQQREAGETAAKKQKKTPQPKPVIRSAKAKRPPATTTGKKPSGRKPLPTPKVCPTSTKRKLKRQVTRTLTSTRKRRVAADKANERLALASEIENAAYDIDDPIESSQSVGAEAKLVQSCPNLAAETYQETPFPLRSDSDADLKGLDEEACNLQSLESNSACELGVSMPGMIPHAEPDPRTLVLPTEALVQEKFLSELTSKPSEEGPLHDSSPTAPAIPTAISISSGDKDEEPREEHSGETCCQDDIIQVLNRDAEGQKRSFGMKLSEALTSAGLLPPNTTDEEVNAMTEEIIDAVSLAESHETQVVRSRSVRTKVSQISKHVSQFISRQVAAAQSPRNLHGPEDASDNAMSAETSDTTVPPPSWAGGIDDQHEKQRSKLHTVQATQQPQPDNPAKPCSILKQPDPKHKQLLEQDGCQAALKRVSLAPTTQTGAGGQSGSRGATIPCRKVNHEHESSLSNTTNCPLNLSPVNAADGTTCGSASSNTHDRCTSKSNSVSEMTETEFPPQAPQLPYNSQRQIVDENGSPRPIGQCEENLHTSNPDFTSQILAEVFDDNSSLQSVQSSLSSSREGSFGCEKDYPSIPKIPSEASTGGVDFVNNPSTSPSLQVVMQNKGSPIPPASRSRKAIPSQGNLGQAAFWAVRAPSKFTERLRGRQKAAHSHGLSKVRKPAREGSYGKTRPSATAAAATAVEFNPSSSPQSAETESEAGKLRCIDLSDTSDSASSSASVTLVEEDRDVESEWQSVLRGTQTTSLDILLDTSKRLMGHLLDEESSIMSVVNTYRNGCDKMIDELEQTLESSLQEHNKQVKTTNDAMRAYCGDIRRKVYQESKEAANLPKVKALSSAVNRRKKLLAKIDASINDYEADDGN